MQKENTTHADNTAASYPVGNRFGIAPGLKPESFRAAELDVHKITLQRARARGDLGFVRVGDRVFYSEEHIVQWLTANERPATRRKVA